MTTALEYSELNASTGDSVYNLGWHDQEVFSFRYKVGKITKDSYTTPHPDGRQTWISFQANVEVEVYKTSLPEENERFSLVSTRQIVGTSLQSWHTMEDEFSKGLAEHLAWKLVGKLYDSHYLPSVRGCLKYK